MFTLEIHWWPMVYDLKDLALCVRSCVIIAGISGKFSVGPLQQKPVGQNHHLFQLRYTLYLLTKTLFWNRILKMESLVLLVKPVVGIWNSSRLYETLVGSIQFLCPPPSILYAMMRSIIYFTFKWHCFVFVQRADQNVATSRRLRNDLCIVMSLWKHPGEQPLQKCSASFWSAVSNSPCALGTNKKAMMTWNPNDGSIH
jgi:hypothetical protein